jgi:hypothetical protein
MITIEEIHEEYKGKEIEAIERIYDQGFLYTRVIFIDGSKIEIDQSLNGEPIGQPQPQPSESEICDVCREQDVNLAKDRRNKAVGTLYLICQALEIEEEDYDIRNAKVRQWARDAIEDHMNRRIVAGQRAKVARPTRKEAKQQEKYGKGA